LSSECIFYDLSNQLRGFVLYVDSDSELRLVTVEAGAHNVAATSQEIAVAICTILLVCLLVCRLVRACRLLLTLDGQQEIAPFFDAVSSRQLQQTSGYPTIIFFGATNQ